jgi:hypothetical protein
LCIAAAGSRGAACAEGDGTGRLAAAFKGA